MANFPPFFSRFSKFSQCTKVFPIAGLMIRKYKRT